MKKARKSGIVIIILGILGILGLLGGLGKLGGSENKRYLVSEVIDGDTIRLADSRDIRYIGIDTPETAKGEKEDECYAQKAKELNKELVLGKEVILEFDINEMDRFGRYLAYVYADAKNPKEEVFINQYLLEQGAGIFFLDTVNLKYQDELIKAAEKGHEEKKGMWNDCALDNKGCVIKGNLDKQDKRWYHLPYFRHYNQVEINLDHGDRWFCTEENAIEEGFEKARE